MMPDEETEKQKARPRTQQGTRSFFLALPYRITNVDADQSPRRPASSLVYAFPIEASADSLIRWQRANQQREVRGQDADWLDRGWYFANDHCSEGVKEDSKRTRKNRRPKDE